MPLWWVYRSHSITLNADACQKHPKKRYNSALFVFFPATHSHARFSRLFANSAQDTVLTIGNFDGVHVGHRALFARLKTHAEKNGLLPAALTFEPHPREFFAPTKAPARLSTLREKLELIADEGIALTCVCHFNKQLATLSADEFIEDILVKACASNT